MCARPIRRPERSEGARGAAAAAIAAAGCSPPSATAAPSVRFLRGVWCPPRYIYPHPGVGRWGGPESGRDSAGSRHSAPRTLRRVDARAGRGRNRPPHDTSAPPGD